MTPLTLGMALAATAVGAVTIFGERLFPFAIFSKREPPKLIRFIEKYIPSMIIAMLIIYSLKDAEFTQAPYGLPYIAGIAAAAGLHLTLKNPMISVFGSTALFMILTRIL